MSDSRECEPNYFREDQDSSTNNDEDEEQVSFTESLLHDAQEAQEAEEDSFSEGLLYDSNKYENVGNFYHETSENRALRETMEQMVTSAIPEPAAGDNSPDEDIIVLSPEHPMLQSFHKSVEIHLKKQKSLLLNDNRELVRYVQYFKSSAFTTVIACPLHVNQLYLTKIHCTVHSMCINTFNYSSLMYVFPF